MSEREQPEVSKGEQAISRFQRRIIDGISAAYTEQRKLDPGTARMIAHVLGRAVGRDSHLAAYGRTGSGEYESLRNEYLDLYEDPRTPPMVREWIDWLGTFLIHQQQPHAQPLSDPEAPRPALDSILVPTPVTVGDTTFTVHVPGIYGDHEINELTDTLAQLSADQDAGLRAYLGLPDVNAMSGDIMEDFHQHYVDTFDTIEDALHALAEVDQRERDVVDFAGERHVFVEEISIDYGALHDEAAGGYDFVEHEGRVYVFIK